LYNLENRRGRYLRPEFLYQYGRDLKADTKKPPPEGLQNRIKEDQDILEINEASKTLKEKSIPNLAGLFDSLTIIPLDSKSLSEAFHSYGVNMRYLGLVALYSNLYHVKDICINEMLARILKQLLNSVIAEMIKKEKEPAEPENSMFRHAPINKSTKGILKKSSSGAEFSLSRNIESKTVGFDSSIDENNSLDKPNISDLENGMDARVSRFNQDVCSEWIRDYFNLVLGDSEDTVEYYETIIFPRIEDYYNFPIDQLMNYEINHTALYYALIYHCGIRIDNEEGIFPKLGKTEKPFEEVNGFQLYTRYKVYPMRNLPIHVFANKYKEFRSQGNNELALSA
jgi:hypothetical protein